MKNDVRPMGRVSTGVRGILLNSGDELVAMQLQNQGDFLLFVSENGMGKRTRMSEFSLQHRSGKGNKCYKITEKTGFVIGAKAVNDESEILLITTEGIMIRIACSDISILGRITMGVKLMNVDENITVAGLAKVLGKMEDDDTEEVEKTEEEAAADESGEAQEGNES